MTFRDTDESQSQEDLRAATKQLFALAMASFPDVSYEKLATWLDESASTLKAWADPKRPHTPHMGVVPRLRQTHPAMAAYLEIGLEALSREGETIRPVQHSMRAQMVALLGSVGRVLTMEAQAMQPGEYDPKRASSIATVLAHHRDVVDRTIAAAQRTSGATPIREAARG